MPATRGFNPPPGFGFAVALVATAAVAAAVAAMGVDRWYINLGRLSPATLIGIGVAVLVAYTVLETVIIRRNRPWRPPNRPVRYRMRSKRKGVLAFTWDTWRRIRKLRRGADMSVVMPIAQERKKPLVEQ